MRPVDVLSSISTFFTLSINYANQGLFRHPCPNLMSKVAKNILQIRYTTCWMELTFDMF